MDLSYFEELFRISPATLVISIFCVVLGILYFLKGKSLPPGPVGLPLVGYWPFLQDETIHLQLQEFSKKYGDVFSFNVGGKLLIHLGSIKAIKEAHLTKSDAFAGRFTDYSVLTLVFKNTGVATANGEQWRVLRKFFVQAFKEYGVTSIKNYMTDTVYDAVKDTVKCLKDTNESPINVISVLNLRSLQIFRRMLFNDGDITEKEIQDVLDAYGRLFTIFAGKNGLLIGDFAKKFLFPRLKNFREAEESQKVMEEYLVKIIRRHEKTYDKDTVRDIIDSYFKERKEREAKGDPTAEYFSESALVSSLTQFVGDGILSVAIFIAYFIRPLLEYPEEQDKIYKELIEVVGPDREVTLEDRNKLPYTTAFMHEVNRTMDFFTYIASLECTKETTLNGYRIPVGAITVTNFWAAHRDPAVFDEPEKFKPSRFMAQAGKPKAETPILFGVGKRSCVGEAFTMMQVFLFLTAIVKNFKLSRPNGESKTSFLDANMEIIAHRRK